VPDTATFPHHGQAEVSPAGLLTRGEVAQRLRVSEHTVARLAESGDLVEVRVTPHSPRITPDSLERHLERIGATSPAMAGSAA
jgi:excisionase family DNA binding protein